MTACGDREKRSHISVDVGPGDFGLSEEGRLSKLQSINMKMQYKLACMAKP